MAVNSTTTATETEIKYEAAAGVTLPSFTDLPQVARAEMAAQEQLDADYFDTEDLRLISAGITLRRRQGGHDAGWHLKLPAGTHTRREIRLPLGRSKHRVPEQLARLVRVRTRGKELKPVARISTARSRQLLLDADGGQLAEVASDDVTARALGRDERVSRWHEVEVELTGGGKDVLDAADRLLQSGGLSRSDQSAKLARALDLPPPARRRTQQVTAHGPAGEVLLSYLEAQVSAIKAYDPMVRVDEPDAVHQMRVATRRLRSTLQTFGGFFSEQEADRLIAELRWLGGELGAARDAEVLGAHVAASLSELPAEQIVGPVPERVRGHFANVGASAQADVLEVLDSARYFALLDDLDALVARPLAAGQATRPASKVLPPAVLRTYKRTKRRMKHGLSLPPGEPGDVALHDARKAAKRARYAGEAVASAFGAPASRFSKQMKTLQSVLGGHQDVVIAREQVREIGMNADQAGESAFTYGILFEREDYEARRLRRQARQVWRSASRPRVRGWLG
jgi:CHAD domain-containing protein